jgi:hypothetical protein
MSGQKQPTPLERLEAWLKAEPGSRDITAFFVREYTVELNTADVDYYGRAPTLDAAILAALEQAKGAPE